MLAHLEGQVKGKNESEIESENEVDTGVNVEVNVPVTVTSTGGESASTSGSEADDEDLEKVTLCHKGQTIEVAPEAVQAHLDHDDTLGPCPEEPIPVID